MKVAFNEDWSFIPGDGSPLKKVTLPHGFRLTPVTWAEAEDDQRTTLRIDVHLAYEVEMLLV